MNKSVVGLFGRGWERDGFTTDEIVDRRRRLTICNMIEIARVDDVSAEFSGAWADIDEVIASAHRCVVVFDGDDRVAAIA